jgi:tRNA pseudouridine32 synthase/23S rRNA pseudouridine746 synthase
VSGAPATAAHDALRVVHADAQLLVIDKPAGLLAVPGRGDDKQDCLAARVQARWPDALVVHRLDQPTSGLMLFARDALTQRRLGSAFEARAVVKRYVAVVDGRPREAEGCIDLPLAADWPNRPRQQVDRAHGKPALTRWWRLDAEATGASGCRMALEPLTGRTHQLRVHLAAIGHPILGDALYAPPAVQARAARLLLHARRLEFVHPSTGVALRLDSAPPF